MWPVSSPPQVGTLSTRLASTPEDLRAAQALRYRVFVQELGGDGPLVDHDAGLEQDLFDPVFDHLLLIDTERDETVVGAYRLLPGDRVGSDGRFYSDAEFDLAPLRQSGRRLLELGRSCVDPAYRGGVAMMLMWQALAEYAVAQRAEILFGAASFPGADLAELAQPLSWLHHTHLAAPELRVRARPCDLAHIVPAECLDSRTARAGVPPLIRSYLRLGASIGEGAFVDHAFNTTDVCILLDVARLSRHAQNLIGRMG
ncbi:MAG: GNAT family N-acetyltransferase [Alphaproteobacteria bacterium]|nr:GNAT family N-acetyltransferase [Alphaproteobacteria bacterium]